MSEIWSKLAEAAGIRAEMAKQENAFWLKISEAIISYKKHPFRSDVAGHLKDKNIDQPEGFLDTKQAAAYLGLKYGALAGWRFQGVGPRYIKLGRVVRYKIKDLEEFASANATVNPPG